MSTNNKDGYWLLALDAVLLIRRHSFWTCLVSRQQPATQKLHFLR